MKYLPAISLGLSVVLGIIAFLVLRSGESERAVSQTMAVREVSAAAPVETVSVLVVKEEVEAGAPVLAEAVDVVEWPRELVPSGAVTRLDGLVSPAGKPLVAQASLTPGEPVLAAKLAETPPRRMLSRSIPDGFRAVSISVTSVTNVSGFVLPGDRVDLLAYVEVPGKTGHEAYRPELIHENVLVLGVDQFMGSEVEGARPASLVTFALKPEDAGRITAAARDSRIGLALIGQEEIKAKAEQPEEEDAAEPVVAPRPAPAPRPRIVRQVTPPPAPRPTTTEVKVVHGTRTTTVTAPVEADGPMDLMGGPSE